MRKYVLLILLNIVLALVQTAFLPSFLGAKATPNLVFALGFALLLNAQTELALFSILIGGLFVDFFVIDIIGLSAFLGTASLYSVYLLRNYFFRGRAFVFIFSGICIYILQMVFTKTYSLDLSLLLSVIITVCLGFFLSKFIKAL
jgi:hypothetical protein